MLGGVDLQLVQGSGDLLIPVHVGNQYSAATLNSASGTGSTVLVTGSPGYIITELGFQADLTCTTTTAGMISVMFVDSSYGTIANFRVYVPTTATPPTYASVVRQVNQGPFVWNNKVAASTLSVNLNTALTAGSIRVFARYALTSFLG